MSYRNEKLRRAVADLPCAQCGREGATQASHRNEGKGMGLKTSDALVAALCVDCHREVDQGKDLERWERRELWDRAFIETMRQLIEAGKLRVS